MIRTLLTEGNPPVPLWIDIGNPTEVELRGLAENYQLHPELVADCLEPAHLPKYEMHGDVTFLIVRYYDGGCSLKADSVQSMTRKLAIFMGDRFLITIHRDETAPTQAVERKYQNAKGPVYLQVVLMELLDLVVETYSRPMEEMEGLIHGYESAVLRARKPLSNWDEVFRIKCRLSVIKRLLWHTLNCVQRYVPFTEANLPMRQDVKETIESQHFFADSLLDDLNALLNIQLSLATHQASETANRANEVMKVLTLFSAFFLPLSFIVGIYGMNFHFMPELSWKYGYMAVWVLLIVTTATIYFWFVRKGWIRLRRKR